MEYINNRDLICTIFVPYSCGNDCEFCNTKTLYNGFQYNEQYLEKIFLNIEICNKSPKITGFIITGGEPFLNLDILKRIIDKIEKPISINTTLPLVSNIDEIINYINTCNKIQFLSISRQLNSNYNIEICDNSYLSRIHKPIKINVLLTENMLNDINIDNFIKQYENISFRINFRGDYMTTTDVTLRNIDNISRYLFNKFEFVESSGCLICHVYWFKYKLGCSISYHRGVEMTSLTFGNRCYVNDIIIDMYGNLYKDWDFVEDTDFNNWILSTIPEITE